MLRNLSQSPPFFFTKFPYALSPQNAIDVVFLLLVDETISRWGKEPLLLLDEIRAAR